MLQNISNYSKTPIQILWKPPKMAKIWKLLFVWTFVWDHTKSV